MNFWDTLQKLVNESEIVIDRPKDSAHPKYPDYIYPFDYGHLRDSCSSDGHEIDCWVGSEGGGQVTGIINVVDPAKLDSEIRILVGCTDKDMNTILKCHGRGEMRGLLTKRI